MNVIYASLVSFRPQDADGFIDATLIEKPIISVSSSAAALLGARTPLNPSTQAPAGQSKAWHVFLVWLGLINHCQKAGDTSSNHVQSTHTKHASIDTRF